MTTKYEQLARDWLFDKSQKESVTLTKDNWLIEFARFLDEQPKEPVKNVRYGLAENFTPKEPVKECCDDCRGGGLQFPTSHCHHPKTCPCHKPQEPVKEELCKKCKGIPSADPTLHDCSCYCHKPLESNKSTGCEHLNTTLYKELKRIDCDDCKKMVWTWDFTPHEPPRPIEPLDLVNWRGDDLISKINELVAALNK